MFRNRIKISIYKCVASFEFIHRPCEPNTFLRSEHMHIEMIDLLIYNKKILKIIPKD